MGRNKPKPVAVTLPDDLLEEIDARTDELDLNRSQYFRRLVRADLERNRVQEVKP